ncbi:auxin-induced 6B-like [Olea europaea subsp. europaea]|uniref:Auxin-induced 6B-like n=1 Tax=Olea europaea subsp. europaea TaxID=158383 RepID=A0A8S0UUG6_OLEEU|nr:auxin-induced 6B-like [Olea europaea subsp. europaea]
MHRQEEKKMKLKKGCVAVQVGLENGPFQRFVIPISYLHNPLFQRLLDRASEFYGYHTSGPLMLPCSVEDFVHLQRQIEMGATMHNRGHRRHHQLNSGRAPPPPSPNSSTTGL